MRNDTELTYVDERAYMLLQECLVAEERNIFQEGFVKGIEIAAFLAGFVLPAFLLVAVIGAAWWAICKCASCLK